MNNERMRLEQKMLEEENARLKRIIIYSIIGIIVIEGEVPADAVAANRVLCRPTRAVLVEAAPAAEESAIKPPTATEGVRLPFD